MKKNGILNSHISEVLSRIGHTDTIVIGDCGLPIPDETVRIDLALKIGTPSFIDTLKVVLEDMAVEQVTLALEIKDHNPEMEEQIASLAGDLEYKYVTHEQFKEQTKKAKAVIRTGEATPYANVILHAGVIF
ncbi:D-ribose pyranase [Bacillus sp. BRMEA1]|uniref:D-ribose pyranase n=1 Tax=Neobacillus endophyticus TaxID=2738405 RepID=UPI0015646217|nr:D-ribose pyranase [Neobacillus endophyticus]NRD76901.1 D-ribose pyranase [Neobacillus endophyticus]